MTASKVLRSIATK